MRTLHCPPHMLHVRSRKLSKVSSIRCCVPNCALISQIWDYLFWYFVSLFWLSGAVVGASASRLGIFFNEAIRTFKFSLMCRWLLFPKSSQTHPANVKWPSYFSAIKPYDLIAVEWHNWKVRFYRLSGDQKNPKTNIIKQKKHSEMISLAGHAQGTNNSENNKRNAASIFCFSFSFTKL